MIQSGNVYRVKMYQNDGITPKGDDTYRYKYIVIIGYDGNSIYGTVATNTRDHPLVPIEFQYPLCHQGYKCFVNCYKLHQVSSARLTDDCYKGKISDNDLDLIIECIKTSPLLNDKVLKKFGII